MQIPLQITFRDMEHSAAVEARIREKMTSLERFYDRITRCDVTVEMPHQHHHKGKLYRVRIHVTVPNGELTASREPHDNHAHEDVYVAIRDAFRAVRRQLEDLSRRRRGDVKNHEAPPHGRITKLVPEQDYGMIATADGREVYFHRNSVIDEDFDRLAIDNEVRFIEESGEQGPQASTVRAVGKHHIAS
ncbi:MAG: cold-shock DNA-binding domain-containing protein [Gammaproteobacteria bacterium]|nr:MAG: cold-shock DNA-binding domain-containing protein [Gammaproteobacteria bacterium]TND04408.1 MAG: cold-shock DNA-binding domain-containing protein [Gammaproteobacteria bacterium]